MTNDELHELAAAGVTQKIRAIEAELATYLKGWPELFLTTEVPRLLKAGSSNGNGNNGNGRRGPQPHEEWPAERRAAYARRMKEQQPKIQAGRRKKRRKVSAAVRRRLSLAMKRRHASGEMAKARARAAKKRAANAV